MSESRDLRDMDAIIQRLFSSFSRDSTASSEECRNIEQVLGVSLPVAYRRVLLTYGGQEGFLQPLGQNFIAIHGPHELLRVQDDEGVAEWFPYLIVFAHDGSEEKYCFDTRSQPMRVVAWRDSVDPVDLVCVAKDFDDFLRRLLVVNDHIVCAHLRAAV